MAGALKPVEWLGDSLDRVRSFSQAVRQQVGFELEMVQRALEPADWKPMPAVGHGVNEIRVHTEGEFRVLYVAKFRRAVYVLHAFIKKTRKTSHAAVSLAKARYQTVLRMEGLKK